MDQGCIKFLVHTWERVKFIKSVGTEFPVVKRGREYHGFGEEYNVEKKVKGKQFHLPNYIEKNINLSGE